MKTDTVFKKAFNDALDLVSKLKHYEPLPSENVLGAHLGVSRTTVRKVLSKFSEAGLIAGSGAQRTVRLTPPQMQRFPDAETIPTANQVERLFHGMDATRQYEPRRADKRTRSCAAIRGSDHQHSGVLKSFPSLRTHREERPNAGWVFKGFTASFALELFEIREMFELRSARRSPPCPPPVLSGGS